MNAETEVGGMASCGENTAPLTCLVERSLVNIFHVLVDLIHRFEPHHWATSVQHLVLRLTEAATLVVPAAAFNPHSVHVNTFKGSLESLDINDVVDDFEVEVHSINGNLVESSVVLKGTSEETMSEEELVDPEVLRNLSFSPVLEEINSLLQVSNVASKGFETRVGMAHPQDWHFTINHILKSRLEVARKKNLSLNGSLDVLEGRADNNDQAVETNELLSKHRVHRLGVTNGELNLSRMDVKRLGHFLEDRVSQSVDNGVLVIICTARGSSLSA
jgi:hypothetical protein